MRVRVRYSISGKVRFISHLDLMRAFFRACIRKDIPVQLSQGFSPHLKMSFGPPLSVGMTSSDEYLDMYTDGPVDKTSLQEGLPEGVKIEDVFEVPEGVPSLCVTLDRAVYIVKVPNNVIGQLLVEDADNMSLRGAKRRSNLLLRSVPSETRDLVVKGEILRFAQDDTTCQIASLALAMTDNSPIITDRIKNNSDFAMDVPIGCRPIDVLAGIWPEAGLDELKLWPIHREKMYNDK